MATRKFENGCIAHIVFLHNAVTKTRGFMLCSHCWKLAEVQGNAPPECLSYRNASATAI